MVDRTQDESRHLVAFLGPLTGHGLSPQPTGLRVTGENGRSAVVMCHTRRDDGDRMWFCVAGGPWLAEVSGPTWALTRIKTYLSE